MNRYDYLIIIPFIIFLLVIMVNHIIDFRWNGAIGILLTLILITLAISWVNYFIKKSIDVEHNKP